jgi:hypothetical protein
MTELMDAGVMTAEKVLQICRQNGDWTDRDDNELMNKSTLIMDFEQDLLDKKDKQSHDENMDFVDKITKVRAEQWKLLARKQGLLNSSADKLAEEQKIHTYARLCAMRVDNKDPFFESDEQYQEFLVEEHEAASVIFEEAYHRAYKHDPDTFGQNWADVQYLKEYGEELKKRTDESIAAEERQNADQATHKKIRKVKKRKKREEAEVT